MGYDLDKKLLSEGFKKTVGKATLYVKKAEVASESDRAYIICVFGQRVVVNHYERWDNG